MRLACPSCAAEYDVPDAALRPGRKLRCAACHVAWQPALTPAAPLPEVHEEPPEDASMETPREADVAPVPAPATTPASVLSDPSSPDTMPADGDREAGGDASSLLAPDALTPTGHDPADAAPTATHEAPARVALAPALAPTAQADASPRAGSLVWFGWFATLMLLAGASWSMWHWRQHIMHHWPASTRLYAVMGTAAPPH